jgi:hypothetical protein
MMEDEEESFYGRPRVQASHEDSRGQHERHGDHGKDHGDHGKEHGQHHKKSHKSCCIIMKIISFTLIASHFFFIRCLKQEQMKIEKITGKKEEKKVCGFQQQQPVYFATQPAYQVVQQPVVVEYSPVIQNTDSSIEEISEDKEIGMVYAPSPTGIVIHKNQMV